MTSTPSTPLRDRCRPISWRPGGALAALRLCGYAARGPTNARRAPWVKRTLSQLAGLKLRHPHGLAHPHLQRMRWMYCRAARCAARPRGAPCSASRALAAVFSYAYVNACTRCRGHNSVPRPTQDESRAGRGHHARAASISPGVPRPARVIWQRFDRLSTASPPRPAVGLFVAEQNAPSSMTTPPPPHPVRDTNLSEFGTPQIDLGSISRFGVETLRHRLHPQNFGH